MSLKTKLQSNQYTLVPHYGKRCFDKNIEVHWYKKHSLSTAEILDWDIPNQ